MMQAGIEDKKGKAPRTSQEVFGQSSTDGQGYEQENVARPILRSIRNNSLSNGAADFTADDAGSTNQLSRFVQQFRAEFENDTEFLVSVTAQLRNEPRDPEGPAASELVAQGTRIPPDEDSSAVPKPLARSSQFLRTDTVYICPFGPHNSAHRGSFQRASDFSQHLRRYELQTRWKCQHSSCRFRSKEYATSKRYLDHHRHEHGNDGCAHDCERSAAKDQWTKKRWACGFCGKVHRTFQHWFKDLRMHFEAPGPSADWSTSLIIRQLLTEPGGDFEEAWRSRMGNAFGSSESHWPAMFWKYTPEVKQLVRDLEYSPISGEHRDTNSVIERAWMLGPAKEAHRPYTPLPQLYVQAHSASASTSQVIQASFSECDLASSFAYDDTEPGGHGYYNTPFDVSVIPTSDVNRRVSTAYSLNDDSVILPSWPESFQSSGQDQEESAFPGAIDGLSGVGAWVLGDTAAMLPQSQGDNVIPQASQEAELSHESMIRDEHEDVWNPEEAYRRFQEEMGTTDESI